MTGNKAQSQLRIRSTAQRCTKNRKYIDELLIRT